MDEARSSVERYPSSTPATCDPGFDRDGPARDSPTPPDTEDGADEFA